MNASTFVTSSFVLVSGLVVACSSGTDPEPAQRTTSDAKVSVIYAEAGCGDAAKPTPGTSSAGALCDLPASYCGCDGATFVGCGMPRPFVHVGACDAPAAETDGAKDGGTTTTTASPARLDDDGGLCAAGKEAVYAAPGCGDDARVACLPIAECQDAQSYCGCDGKTVQGCGQLKAPYARAGACDEDAGVIGVPDGSTAH